MKKLSILLLAAVMIFTCFALAACGDEETPADTSSTSKTPSTAETSSETATSSEPEASEPETSEPEASEPEASEPETSEPETSTGDPVDAEPSEFWVTHYDDYTQEGAGMILTADAAISSWDGAWCDHYAFKPIDGVENGYELVELSYGTIADGDATYNGSGKTPALPEGGFIYSTSIGNNYTSEGIDASKPDYVNDACNAQISRSRTWKVGDQFIITGVDLEGKTVPKSSGDDIMWYQDGYVCTATIQPIA